jgi:hypothetical protein
MAVSSTKARQLLPPKYRDAQNVAALTNQAMAVARFALELLESEWQPTTLADEWADAWVEVSSIPKREAHRLAQDAIRQETMD